VWCGVVWCGVVWCGVVWCGAVWCGVVVWCDIFSICLAYPMSSFVVYTNVGNEVHQWRPPLQCAQENERQEAGTNTESLQMSCFYSDLACFFWRIIPYILTCSDGCAIGVGLM
jgi:hypothetical protein